MFVALSTANRQHSPFSVVLRAHPSRVLLHPRSGQPAVAPVSDRCRVRRRFFLLPRAARYDCQEPRRHWLLGGCKPRRGSGTESARSREEIGLRMSVRRVARIYLDPSSHMRFSPFPCV